MSRPSESSSPSTSSIENHNLDSPLAQTLAETQASLERASDVIESAYQRLASLRESIRRNLENMPHDLPEPSPLTRTGVGAGARVGSSTSTATATSGTSMPMSMSMGMGPNHSAIVLSDPQPGLVESRSNSPSVIAESYERTRSAVTATGTGISSGSGGVAQRTPWVSWNGYAINPYDHRGGGSQVMDLRTGRRGGTTNSPTRRALVEHYITYRRDTHPNDASTSLGRSVEGRTSAGSGSTSQEPTGSGSNDGAPNFEGLTTDIESVITRLNRYSDELSIASGGFRRGLGSLDFLTGDPLQPEPPRGLSDQVVSSSRPASRPDMNGQISGSGSVETQRSAWRTVNPPPQDPQRVPMGIATRFRARPRPGLAFPHPPPSSSAPSQPPSAGPSLSSTSMTNTSSRGERTSRPTRFHSRFPVVTISDNENYNDDSEDELEPFSFWLGRVRREEPNRVRTNLQALAPPPASGTGMNSIPPPESLTNALRERLDRLRQSFGGVAGADVLAQRTTISGLGDGLTNGRRRRRGWGKWLLRAQLLCFFVV